jgi:hypothetical protein
MGIDKPNIRLISHRTPPANLEAGGPAGTAEAAKVRDHFSADARTLRYCQVDLGQDGSGLAAPAPTAMDGSALPRRRRLRRPQQGIPVAQAARRRARRGGGEAEPGRRLRWSRPG